MNSVIETDAVLHLSPPSQELRLKILEQLEEPRVIKRCVEELKKWISTQPHLPQDCEDVWLERFFCGCKCDLERCKKVLDKFFTIRGSVREFFSDRDPTLQDIRDSVNCVSQFILPQHHPNGCRILCIRLMHEESAHFVPHHFFKRILMTIDVLLQEETCLGYVFIVDMKFTQWGHILKLTPLFLRKVSQCVTDSMPLRMTEIHFLNVPAFMDKILMIIKPFMKEKIRKRIHVHSKGFENLHKIIGRDVLPEEYDGQMGSIKDLNEAWQTKLESYRDWFLAEEKRKTDESKRPGKRHKRRELQELEPCFQNLSID